MCIQFFSRFRALILTFRKWAVRWHGSKPEGEHTFLCCKTKKNQKTHKLPLIGFEKKKQSQQLTWCWFTCFIILSNSSVALPPSVFTSMNKGAGRASSTLTRMQLLVTAALFWCTSALLGSTCSMSSQRSAGSVLTENLMTVTNISQTPARTGRRARYFCLSHWRSAQSLPSRKQAPKQTIMQMIAFVQLSHNWTFNPYVAFGSCIKITQLPATFFMISSPTAV